MKLKSMQILYRLKIKSDVAAAAAARFWRARYLKLDRNAKGKNNYLIACFLKYTIINSLSLEGWNTKSKPIFLGDDRLAE